MKGRWWIVVVVVVIVACLGYAGVTLWQRLSGQGAALEAPAEETAVAERGTLRVTIGASGSLAPATEVALAFLSGGEVAEVLVEEGERVEAGQPLVRLEADELALQVAQAEAALAAAEAQLVQMLAPPRPEEVAAQEANLEAAQAQVSAAAANRDQLTAGASAAQIAAAESQVASAEAQHKIAANETTEAALAAAQAQLDELLAGADGDEVRAAQASVWGAMAQRDAAQAQLDLLLAGPTEEELGATRASVEQARVGVEQAELRLEQATLTAPMAGTVTGLYVHPGEIASAGQPIVVLSELEVLEVEVNLDETDVAQASVGQGAIVTLDAFPDVELGGEVASIAPVAEIQSGVVLYPVTVRLASTDLPVRAGMTADVEIVVISKENALIVPLRAIHTEGEHAYVYRLVGDQVERMEVELGLVTDTEVEIISGLEEGDVVSVVAAPTRGFTGAGFGPGGIFGGGE